MQKHCASHTHYQSDCFACKQAYARYKSGVVIPEAKKVPGQPYDLKDAVEVKVGEANGWEVGTPHGDPAGGPSWHHDPRDLSKLSVPELRKLCSKEGITRIEGMPVSNCRRDQLIAALTGQPIPGGSEAGSGREGQPGQEYGPQEGKSEPQPIPPPMVPFADAILKSKEFEDAVRHADVLGDVKADFAEVRDQHRAMSTAIGKLASQIKEQGPGMVKIEVHAKEGLPIPTPEEDAEIPNSPILKRIIEHLMNREHVALVGPAGSGKSTLIRLACKALKAELYHTPCGGDIREQHLLGRTIPVKGEWTYIPAPFVTAFESEGFAVSMLDEMDGVSDPSVLLPINDVLAGFDKLHLPWRWSAPYAERGKGFLGVAATMNTIGAGATSLYQGRSALDGSTLDRFVGRVIIVPYDAAYEEAYVRGPEGTPVTPHGDKLLLFVRHLRQKIEANNLRRIVSTRMLQQGVAFLRRGWSFEDTKKALLVGWSPDDLAIVGEKN